MATNVGGINIGMGIDVGKMIQGIEVAETRLRSFQSKLTNIKLASVIKGDPFGETRKYIKTARVELNSVFDTWSEKVNYVAKDFSRFAEAARKTSTEAVSAFQKVEKKWNTLVELGKTGSKGLSLETLGMKKSGTNQDFFKTEQFQKSIEKFKGVSSTADKVIRKLVKDSKEGLTLTNQVIKERLDKIGVSINKEGSKVVKEYLEYGNDLKKAIKKTAAAEQGELTLQSKSGEAARERKIKSLRKLRLAENKANAERKQGIDVGRNIIKLQELMNRRVELGVNLTKKQARALKILNYRAKEVKNSFTGLEQAIRNVFNPKWLASKALWFLQLRLLWDAWRLVGVAMGEVVKMDEQIARVLRTVNSEVMSSIVLYKALAKAMGDMAAAHGADFEQTGEVLYQLGSAGLSAEEALAALDTTLALIIATEGEVRDVTKVVAGLYNNYADSIENATTKAEKFAYITDLMAAAWQKHQIEISELTDGYKQSIAMTQAAGVSLSELTALLAVANDHMIKGGRAGRALTNVFMRISRSPIAFRDAFNIPKEAFDPTKPLKLIKVIEMLGKRMKDGALSMYELSKAFESLGLRGAPIFEMFLQNYEDIGEAQEDLLNNIGKTFEIEAQQLDSFAGEWSRFLGRLKRDFNEIMHPTLELFKDLLYSLRINDIIDEDIKALGKLQSALGRMHIDKILGITVVGQAVKLDKATVSKGLEEVPTADLERLKSITEIKKKAASDMTLVDKRRQKLEKELTGGILAAIDQEIYRRQVVEVMAAKSEERAKGFTTWEAKQQELQISDAEIMFNILDDSLSIQERLALTESLIYDKRIKLNEALEDAKNLQDSTVREAEFKEHLTALRADLNKTLAIRDKLLSKETINLNEEVKKEISRYRLSMAKLDVEEKGLKIDRDRLYVSGITAKKAKRLVELNNEIYEIDSDRVSYQNRINEAKKLDVKLSDKLAKMGYRTARLGLYREEEKLQKAILKYKKEGIALKYDKQIADLQYRIKFLQLTKGNLKDIWSLQVLINSLSIERQKELANLAIDENELMAISNKTLTIETNRLALLEQQKRALIPIYDAYMRIKESVMTVNELISDSVTNLASGLGSGVGTIMTDLTGGFQEQQQEVIDLQGELKELDAEYKNAISEGNVEEAANLKKEMAALNTEISDLEDPIKNIGEAFKDMLKGVVDGIREVINQWIAMQIITGIMKAVIPTPSASGGANIANYSGGMASYHATGGLLPNVKSFKRFSNGGVTDDLTMAVLGDNASKKEIVIPTENISKNNVSGHMQESGGDTYIINAVTERDLAMALSKPMPGKVIVNRVYADLDSRGKIARKLGG